MAAVELRVYRRLIRVALRASRLESIALIYVLHDHAELRTGETDRPLQAGRRFGRWRLYGVHGDHTLRRRIERAGNVC